MIRKFHFCSVVLLVATSSSLSTLDHSLNDDSTNNLLINVFNQPLEPCGDKTMTQGSWDAGYKCSQQNGGVHQICIQKIAQTTNKFSLNTGQTDWSTARGDNNHCVCLGAWSLYVARKNKNQISDGDQKQLKCSAIPRIALTKNYVKKFSKKNPSYQGWQRWNGLQLQNQIIDGVNQLFRQCSQQGNQSQVKNLRNNYCDFAKGIDLLQKSETYLKQCIVQNL